jgi:beta-glucosidase/6-phospho-beta-glucosidase/beta-galactosidase
LHPPSAKPFPYLTGFEGTRFAHSQIDVLETSEHAKRYPQDFDLLVQDGITSFRCCIPWHRVEEVAGVYDWTWLDEYLGSVQAHGLEPIADPLHHSSFPRHMVGGFGHPEFALRYQAFIAAFAQRYPWIRRYTPANEPVLTSWFCGGKGVWHPYGKNHDHFISMLRGVSQAICLASNWLIENVPDLELVHVERCGRNYAFDAESVPHAERLNEEQFAVLDLIMGRVGPHHPLYAYFKRHGMTDDDLAWFRHNQTRVDIIGMDYYTFSSEMGWDKNGRVLDHPVVGYTEIGLEYVSRYGLPIMLTETNIPGFVEDRITHLKFMTREAEKLAQNPGVDFRGFCWYPYIDSTGWSMLLQQASKEIDPQGIYWLDSDFDRTPSELSQLYGKLARHEITSKDLPLYDPCPEVLGQWRFRNCLPLLKEVELLEAAE